MKPISKVTLYRDPASKNLVPEIIKDYIEDTLGLHDIDIRDEFMSCHYLEDTDGLAKRLAGIKVRDLGDPDVEARPMHGEVRFEKNLLAKPEARMTGILYDGFKLMDLLQSMMMPDSIKRDDVHIVFTSRLFGTFDEGDRRYHARAIICGYPSIISTTGIVEAPAKPREFYRVKGVLAMIAPGQPLDDVKDAMKERFIDMDDERITEIAIGYVMQALFHHIESEPFCEYRNCRLFNAHWQEDLIYSQTTRPEYCARHKKIIDEFAKFNRAGYRSGAAPSFR